MKTIYIGVDPGKQGGIAAIDENGSYISALDLPHTQDGTLHAEELCEFLCGIRKNAMEYDMSFNCVLEYSMGHGGMLGSKQSVMSQGFEQGAAYGALSVQSGMRRSEVVPVSPREWKQAFGLSDDKDASLLLAQMLTPGLPEHALFGRNGGYKDGRAEALLLAHYARAIDASVTQSNCVCP